MAHEHHHEDQNAYYVEQLCAIGIGGALGLVALLMWWTGRLTAPLGLTATFFQPAVVGGAFALLVVIAIRGIIVWQSSAQSATAHHDHDHEHHHHDHVHNHDHDHEHCDHHHEHGHGHEHAHGITAERPVAAHEHGPHSHVHPPVAVQDHGHEHGWAPWRYVVLLLPIMLCILFFFLNPIGSLQGRDFNPELDPGGQVTVKDKTVINLPFLELQQAVVSPTGRSEMQGKIGRLKGQFVPGPNNHQFTLARFKVSCCAADAIQLNAVILSTESLDLAQYDKRWVQVIGVIEFRKRRDLEQYVAVLKLLAEDDEVIKALGEKPIQIVEAESNPYLY